MLIPIRHENDQTRRWPIVAVGLIAMNLIAFLLTLFASFQGESPELAQTKLLIRLMAASHPELTLSPGAKQIVDESKQSDPAAWAAAARNQISSSQDAENGVVRPAGNPAMLQQEMDILAARYEELHPITLPELFSFVPARHLWYSYMTANFFPVGAANLFSVGILQVLVVGWFLWMSGVVLEGVLGRGPYFLVYVAGGAFALQVYSWCSRGSSAVMVGASGALAALMGTILVCYPKLQIEVKRYWGDLRLRLIPVSATFLVLLWFAIEIFLVVVFDSGARISHVAHLGSGLAFGMLVGTGIRYSKKNEKNTGAVEEKVDLSSRELDRIQAVIYQNRLDEALADLDRFAAANPESERALLLRQGIHWRKEDVPAYAQVTQKLCSLHLSVDRTDRALKDYEDLVQTGGALLPAETWIKLCQALEKQGEYERALGEYQELADAYPKERQAPMALLAGARIALEKVSRPQQALNLFQAAASCAVPYLDLEFRIQTGMKQAQEEIVKSAAAGK